MPRLVGVMALIAIFVLAGLLAPLARAQSLSSLDQTVSLHPPGDLPTAPAPTLSVAENEALLRVTWTNTTSTAIPKDRLELIVSLPTSPASLALAGTPDEGAKATVSDAAFTVSYSSASDPPDDPTACTAIPDFTEEATLSSEPFTVNRDQAIKHVCLSPEDEAGGLAEDETIILDIVLNAPGILFGVTDQEAGVLSGLSDDNTLFLVANQAGGLTPGRVSSAPDIQAGGALAARYGDPVGSVQDWPATGSTGAVAATVPEANTLPIFKDGDTEIAWPGLEIAGGNGSATSPLYLPNLATGAGNLTFILAGEYQVAANATFPNNGILLSFTPGGSEPGSYLITRTNSVEFSEIPDFGLIRSDNADIAWNGVPAGEWDDPFVLTLVARAGAIPDLYWNGTWLPAEVPPGDRLHIAQSLTEGALFGDNGGFSFSPPIRLGSALVTGNDLTNTDLNTLVQAAANRVGATGVTPIKPSILPELYDAEGEILASLDDGADTVIPVSVTSGEDLNLVVTVRAPDGTLITDDEARLLYTDIENFDLVFIDYNETTGERTINWSDGTPLYDSGGANVYELPLYIESGETGTAYVHRRDYVFEVTVEPPANAKPVFTASPSGGNLWITAYTPDNSALFTFTATDTETPSDLTFNLAGADASSGAFSLGASSGVLTLVDARVPDADGDNVYSLTVEVSDGEASTPFDLSVRRLAADDTELAVFTPSSTGFFYLAGVSELSRFENGGGDQVTAHGDPIRRMDDLSGNGHDGVSDSAESQRPLLAVTQGLPAFDLRGGPRFFNVSGLSKPQNTSLTAIFVLEPNSTSNDQYLLDIATGRTVLAYVWRAESDSDAQKRPVAYYDGEWTRGGSTDAWDVSANKGKRLILTYRLGYDDAGSLQGAIYLNDDLDTPLVTGSYTPLNLRGTIRLGMRYSGNSYPYDGLIYSALLVDRALTLSEIGELVAIAKERYAIE